MFLFNRQRTEKKLRSQEVQFSCILRYWLVMLSYHKYITHSVS